MVAVPTDLHILCLFPGSSARSTPAERRGRLDAVGRTLPTPERAAQP